MDVKQKAQVRSLVQPYMAAKLITTEEGNALYRQFLRDFNDGGLSEYLEAKRRLEVALYDCCHESLTYCGLDADWYASHIGTNPPHSVDGDWYIVDLETDDGKPYYVARSYPETNADTLVFNCGFRSEEDALDSAIKQMVKEVSK